MCGGHLYCGMSLFQWCSPLCPLALDGFSVLAGFTISHTRFPFLLYVLMMAVEIIAKRTARQGDLDLAGVQALKFLCHTCFVSFSFVITPY